MLKNLKNCFSQFSLVKSNQYEILRLTGKDKINLLHNITTNNIKNFFLDENQISLNTLLLEPKGRIITDFQILKPQMISEKKIINNNSEIWIKIQKNAKDIFLQKLKIYSFKKEIMFEEITKFLDLLFFYDNYKNLDFTPGQKSQFFYDLVDLKKKEKDGIFDFASSDPRSPLNGHFIIGFKKNNIENYFSKNSKKVLKRSSDLDYIINRLFNYVFEVFLKVF